MRSPIYQLKITLVGSKPPIWRRILLPGNSVFWDLHVAIQDAFGWQDKHLHQFHIKHPNGRDQNYPKILVPEPEIHDENDLDERKIKLLDWLLNINDKIYYEYDFGDSWIHEIKLEKIVEVEPKVKYPVLLDGKNACPLEDCGGIGGYYDLLKILGNPGDPQHKDMLEWMGLKMPSDFNPENFDKNSVKFRDSKKALKNYEKYLNL